LLDSGGEELRLLGLDQMRRVDDFIAPVGQAFGVAALVLAVGGVLALPSSGGAGHGQHDHRAFREAGRLGAELRGGRGYRLHRPAELADMTRKVLAVLHDSAANQPAPCRAPYLLSPILFPAAPPGTGQ
jgi:hypothetical protein